uniref:Histone deacetylase complex subunit SAP18 n=1 Tax=Aureoumbra lagunensis TaxID=44058 RepID=A0A7S3JSF8_9STRA|mmetsp:Transcript_21817/g.33551  ORF Transcript_21817/g.33551 Transcript_21817/m.33551 type:complete len:152 (+) Transcript_21817:44-499(+)
MVRRTPMLIRIFLRYEKHNIYENDLPKDELQTYLWSESTMCDIVDVVLEACQSLRKPKCKLSIATVYPDKHGNLNVKKIGVLWAQQKGRDYREARMTLQDIGFEPGDFIDVAVLGIHDYNLNERIVGSATSTHDHYNEKEEVNPGINDGEN